MFLSNYSYLRMFFEIHNTEEFLKTQAVHSEQILALKRLLSFQIKKFNVFGHAENSTKSKCKRNVRHARKDTQRAFSRLDQRIFAWITGQDSGNVLEAPLKSLQRDFKCSNAFLCFIGLSADRPDSVNF